MKFGLFHSVQLPDPTRQQEYYDEALDQVLWALGPWGALWSSLRLFPESGGQ